MKKRIAIGLIVVLLLLTGLVVFGGIDDTFVPRP